MIKNNKLNNLKVLYFLLIFSFLIAPLISSLQNMLWKDLLFGGIFSPLMTLRGGLLFLFCFLLYNITFNKGKLFHTVYPLLFICAYVLFVSIFHPYPFRDYVYISRIIYLCVIFFVSYSLTQKDILQLRTLQIVALIVIVVVFILQILAFKYNVIDSAYKSDYASSGFTGSSSRTAAMVYMAIPLFMLTVKWTRLKTIAIFLGIVSCMLTLRRTGLGAIVILFFIDHAIKILVKGYSRKVKILSIIIPLIVSSAFFVALSMTSWGNDFQNRLMDLDVTSGGTGSGRTEFQVYGIERILERDLTSNILGDGFGFSEDYLTQKFGHAIFFHSDWLEVTVSAGIISLIAYALFWINLLRLANKTKKYQNDIFGVVIASIFMLFFVSVASGGTFRPVAAYLFTLWGYIAAKNDIKRNNTGFFRNTLTENNE